MKFEKVENYKGDSITSSLSNFLTHSFLKKLLIRIMKKIITTALLFAFAGFSVQAQLLYRISGNGLQQPSYIIGTYHLAPASFADEVPGLKEAIDGCQQVYGELDLVDVSKPENRAKFQAAQYLPEGKTLRSLLTDEQIKKLNGVLREVVGKDLNNEAVAAQMDRLTPAAMSSSLIVMAYSKDNPSLIDASQLLDYYFQKVAVESGKGVGGFETVDFQVDVLYGAPLEKQISDLMCQVEHFQEIIDMGDFVAAAYFDQDLDQLQDITEEESLGSCSSTPEEEDKLIYNRNSAWVEAMPKIMAEKPTFFAVGAAHLCGERGVLALLKKAGYTVEGVK